MKSKGGKRYTWVSLVYVVSHGDIGFRELWECQGVFIVNHAVFVLNSGFVVLKYESMKSY